MSPWNSYTEVGHTIHGLLLGEAHLRMSYIPMVVKYPLTYRNFRDAVTLEDLDLEIHFAKEAQILSKDAKSNTRLIDGINLVLARNYSENLKEEVKKGMREEASQGIYPGHAPFGYRNNKAERTIEVDPLDSPMVTRLMELYATGAHTLSTLRKFLKSEYGKTMSRGNIHLILTNRFYVGSFEWSGETYRGTHPLFISDRALNAKREFVSVTPAYRYPFDIIFKKAKSEEWSGRLDSN